MRVERGDGTSFKVCGVRVDALQIQDVIARIEDWAQKGLKGNWIAFTGFHGIIESEKDRSFKKVLNSADLVVPDGMSLVLLGRIAGGRLKERAYGPDLMDTFLKRTGSKYRHFLYGGAVGKGKELLDAFSRRYPGVSFVGVFTPPFSGVSADEDAAIVETINRSKADILWVGISTPKQERWMAEHRDRLSVHAMAGVGAAFDFLTGRKPQAPVWARDHGLEWFFRLVTEPGRLWRRYLIDGPRFLWAVMSPKKGSDELEK